MRDYILEAWLSSRLKQYLGPPSVHSYGWSWVGGCLGSKILQILYPEAVKDEQKGNMYPGSMLHEFMQSWVFEPGIRAADLEVLSHEHQVFIPMEHYPFRMSPIDTLVYDHKNHCFGVIDYKSAKDLTWVQDGAKEDNREQVNLYAHVFNAEWYMIIYVDKVNYDNFLCHKYETDHERGEATIEKLRKVDNWLNDEEYRKTVPWTSMATALTKFSGGKTPYRYICEPSVRTPSYKGCPHKEHCLKLLSDEYNHEFTSFVRYDKYLRSDDV